MRGILTHDLRDTVLHVLWGAQQYVASLVFTGFAISFAASFTSWMVNYFFEAITIDSIEVKSHSMQATAIGVDNRSKLVQI